MNRVCTPYLSVCPNCGKHARIVFPDGSKSNDFILFEEGVSILKDAYKARKLSFEEMKSVEAQLNSSTLLRIEDLVKDVEKMVRENAEMDEMLKFKTVPDCEGFVMN